MAPTPSSHESGHHHHHTGKRIRHFLHPDGRKIHVALSPAEAVELRRQLENADPLEPFDITIHGSPEHVEALRVSHRHHETLREELRTQNTDAYESFEKVHHELDAISAELHNITEHDVALDASFSKFGYSAHLRTRDTPKSSNNSTFSDDRRDWKSEKTNGQGIKFYKKPVVRQYFHKGLLWRASDVEEVASFELFVDLLYVGIIAINGDTASEAPTGASLLRFAITFIISWKVWTDMTLIVSWFETDDILQRLSVLFVMSCLFGVTTNLVEYDHTYTQLIAFYLASRLFSAAYFVILSFIIPMIRAIILANAILIVIPSALWIASTKVEEPNRQGLIWVALVIDLFGSTSIIFLTRGVKHFSKRLGERIENYFQFYPAVNIEHRTARTDAFVTLVFGYSVVSILYQNKAAFGLNAFFGKAILGLVQAFAFNWLYFEIDGVNLYKHAIRRHIGSATVWIVIHLPFIMAYVLAAAALSRLVVAHDCADANVEDLNELYVKKSEEHISIGLRWFYCAGLGIALACMGGISMSHNHKDIAGALIRKRHRLTVRFAVSIILICLGLTRRLNSLQLIGTTTSLVVLVLIVDLYGVSTTDESFFGRDRKCSYSADINLNKKDIEHAFKTGQKIKVSELGKKDKGEKGVYELS